MKRTRDDYIASYLDKYNYSKKEYRDTLEQVTVSDNMSYQSTGGDNKLNILKESIKSSARQIKGDKAVNNSNVIPLETHKSEKDRLIEYYQSLKTNSRLNLSKDKISTTAIEKKPYVAPAEMCNNEFVIYDCFKNMLKASKRTEKVSDEVINTRYVNNIADYRESCFTNINPIEHTHDRNETMNSMIKDLKEIDIGDIDHKKTAGICKNSHCIYYKKKYKFYKDGYEGIKLKLKKEKKMSEMLNLKLFYESNKHLLASQTDRSEKLNSTGVTTHRDNESKLTKELYEKLEENISLFEKLENEILNKNTIIEKQNETILHQKDTIDKLLSQINIYLNSGAFMNTQGRGCSSENLNKLIEITEQTKKEVDEYKESDLTVSFSLTKSNNKGVESRQDGDFTNSHVFDITNTMTESNPNKQINTNFVDHEIQDILNNN
jgi:hypothetical protein